MATALSILLAGALTAWAAPYRAPAGDWSADVPAGWEASVEEAPERATTFAGPVEPGQNRRSAIICAFYPKTHPETPTPERFLKAMTTTAPDFRLRAKKPKKTKLAGRAATRFSTSRLVNVPDARTISKDVRSVDDFVVLPVDGGFWALQLSASEAHYPKVKPLFETFLKSFRLIAR